MTCPQPSMTVRVRLSDLFRRIAHGTQHMRALDMAIRLVLLLSCLVVATWMISRGELGWPLVGGAAGALSLATDAVALYAVGAACDRLAALEGRRPAVPTGAPACGPGRPGARGGGGPPPAGPHVRGGGPAAGRARVGVRARPSCPQVRPRPGPARGGPRPPQAGDGDHAWRRPSAASWNASWRTGSP